MPLSGGRRYRCPLPLCRNCLRRHPAGKFALKRLQVHCGGGGRARNADTRGRQLLLEGDACARALQLLRIALPLRSFRRPSTDGTEEPQKVRGALTRAAVGCAPPSCSRSQRMWKSLLTWRLIQAAIGCARLP